MGLALCKSNDDDRTNYFAEAEQKFLELTKCLHGHKTQRMDLSDLENLLDKDGRELLRLLLKAHIDSRGNGDLGFSIDGSDKIHRNHKRIGERQIRSIFGKIEMERMGYGQRGEDSLFPKDSVLNLPQNSYSHQLEKRIAFEALKGSFDNTVESIAETTGMILPKQQIEHTTVRVAQDFDAFYEVNASKDKLREIVKIPLQVLTVDCKGILMRKEDLRPLTKKRSNESERKLNTRLSRGEKKNSKRMATVASVYNIEKFVRTPEDFRRELSQLSTQEIFNRPKPVAKRVWASVEKDSYQVINEIFNEGFKRDPDLKKKWVVLLDGSPYLIDQVEKEAKSQKVKITVVCDIIHVIEYLWDAAWAFFKEGDSKAEEWVNERFIAILEGKSSIVAAGIRRSATNREYSKKDRMAIDKCSDYLINKREYLKYNEYLEQGFPIATGIIEGACRHLIKDRMDITGARWRLAGAEAILKLRSLKSSGDFTEYWKFHEKQEFLRNHKSKYRKPSSVINKNRKFD